MATFKKFKAQDIIISPLEVNKGFTFSGDALTGSDVNIDRFIGRKGDYLISQSLTGQITGQEQPEVLVYDSIKQLYYTNYISGSGGGKYTTRLLYGSVIIAKRYSKSTSALECN